MCCPEDPRGILLLPVGFSGLATGALKYLMGPMGSSWNALVEKLAQGGHFAEYGSFLDLWSLPDFSMAEINALLTEGVLVAREDELGDLTLAVQASRVHLEPLPAIAIVLF